MMSTWLRTKMVEPIFESGSKKKADKLTYVKELGKKYVQGKSDDLSYSSIKCCSPLNNKLKKC